MIEKEPPRFTEPGKLVFGILGPNEFGKENGIAEYEIISTTGAAFWIVEEGFADYWLDDNVILEVVVYPSYFTLEGVTGSAHKDYWGEVEVEYDFQLCRYATQEEINGAIPKKKKRRGK